MRARQLLLGSASPRRRELLAAAGVVCAIEAPAVDEELTGEFTPWDAAVEVAQRKARALLERHRGGELFVLCADTTVGVPTERGWSLLAKANDREEARAMLTALSGTTQTVCTGLCVARCSDGELFTDVESTRVTMRALAPFEIEAYLDTDEWCDKAGAYGIQGRADAFVVGLEGGGLDNVIGLPVERALALVARAGLELRPRS